MPWLWPAISWTASRRLTRSAVADALRRTRRPLWSARPAPPHGWPVTASWGPARNATERLCRHASPNRRHEKAVPILGRRRALRAGELAARRGRGAERDVPDRTTSPLPLRVGQPASPFIVRTAGLRRPARERTETRPGARRSGPRRPGSRRPDARRPDARRPDARRSGSGKARGTSAEKDPPGSAAQAHLLRRRRVQAARAGGDMHPDDPSPDRCSPRAASAESRPTPPESTAARLVPLDDPERGASTSRGKPHRRSGGRPPAPWRSGPRPSRCAATARTADTTGSVAPVPPVRIEPRLRTPPL